MPLEDAQRWDARYLEESRYASFEQPRRFLVEQGERLPRSGLALDVAMGLGGNAGFLLERGLRVIGVDISGIAVRRAKRRHPQLMAVQADLTHWRLPESKFDVIVNFYYLQRDLWPQYLRALRPDGWLIIETMTREILSLQPDIDARYLLEPGELQRAFAGLEIASYWEGWQESDTGHPRAVACMAAYKKSS